LQAFLLVRAHVPVDRVIPSAPRLIFVGEAASSDDRSGTFDSIRLLGFVPAGGPFRPHADDLVIRALTIVPALGFASFRVVGHARTAVCQAVPVVRVRVRARPRCRVIGLRSADLPPAYPLVGVTASFPVERSRRARRRVCPPTGDALTLFLPGLLPSAAKSPALQRVVGLMPGRSDEPRDPPDRLPV